MGEKRIPTYLSLSPRGRMELLLLHKHNASARHLSDTIEKCIHSEASRLPKELKARLKEEQRVCPMAGKCDEIYTLFKRIMEGIK